ncbi:MAG: N-acetyl-alpha-D-glucosaminyl L-malate synthase BshA [Polyangiales bacterium]|jgi:N-acetyl-alpha-D-glucosaminyl L-malate synthase BshA
MVCPPSFGGSAVVASELASSLFARGDRVEIVSTRRPPRHGDVPFRKASAPEYAVFESPPTTLALASSIADAVEAIDANVVHAHYALPNGAAALLAKQFTGRDLRVVVTLHGTDVVGVGKEGDYARATRWCLGAADVVTAVSRSLQSEANSAFGIKPLVVPNFAPQIHDEAADVSASNRLVHISNCREVKRPVAAIEAFAALRREQDAELVFVGEGPLLGDVRKRAKELGVDGAIEFIGHVEDPYAVLHTARALLVTSAYESFSMAALEAMACGVPVVATRVGGLPEVVIHGESGLLGTDHPASLVPLLLRLWKDAALAKTLGESGRARARATFGRDAIIDRYRALYR